MKLQAQIARVALVIAVVSASLAAQEGNGVGNAFVRHNAPVLGSTLTIEFGAPGVAFGSGLISLSDGYGPTYIPGFGQLWLDLYSPGVLHLPVSLDSAGIGSISAFLPANPIFAQAPPIYLYVALFDPALPAPSVTISKTVAIEFNTADGYRKTNLPMYEARGLHSANSTHRDERDNRTKVLVAGGGGGSLLTPTATTTTELFWPFLRIFAPGPSMSLERTVHRTVKLMDGRILICGGINSLGAATAHCEIYDPATDQMVPTGAMNTPRVGHAITMLLDGRVLVSGGMADYTNANTALATALNTAQDTAEIYDMISGQWTPVSGTMSSKRCGHAQTMIANGLVLVSGGMTGGFTNAGLWGNVDLPLVTATCEVFDPVTNSFSPAPAMTSPRAFHGASPLGNGDLLVSGGIIPNTLGGTTNATTSCERFDGTVWSTVGNLPVGVAFHTQFVSKASGDAIIQGGLTGNMSAPSSTSAAGRHNGTDYTALGNVLGQNSNLVAHSGSSRGGHTATELYDGSYLILGGSGGFGPIGTGYVYYDQ